MEEKISKFEHLVPTLHTNTDIGKILIFKKENKFIIFKDTLDFTISENQIITLVKTGENLGNYKISRKKINYNTIVNKNALRGKSKQVMATKLKKRLYKDLKNKRGEIFIKTNNAEIIEINNNKNSLYEEDDSNDNKDDSNKLIYKTNDLVISTSNSIDYINKTNDFNQISSTYNTTNVLTSYPFTNSFYEKSYTPYLGLYDQVNEIKSNYHKYDLNTETLNLGLTLDSTYFNNIDFSNTMSFAEIDRRISNKAKTSTTIQNLNFEGKVSLEISTESNFSLNSEKHRLSVLIDQLELIIKKDIKLLKSTDESKITISENEKITELIHLIVENYSRFNSKYKDLALLLVKISEKPNR